MDKVGFFTFMGWQLIACAILMAVGVFVVVRSAPRGGRRG